MFLKKMKQVRNAVKKVLTNNDDEKVSDIMGIIIAQKEY